MNNILFIADFFANQIPGGGELNNDIAIKELIKLDYKVICCNSHAVDLEMLNLYNKIIVGNFMFLSSDCRDHISQYKKYIIYEHDHKYLINRDPGLFENFTAPEEEIVNREFYKNAVAVLCQTGFHRDIIYSNLKLNNLVNLGGNLWSDKQLELMEELSDIPKATTYAIMDSMTPHKNTAGAVRYCEHVKLEYELISDLIPEEFYKKLASHKGLIFFPKTPETLSRVVTEARMMNLSTKTTNNIGALYEDWFRLKGKDLITYMKSKRYEIMCNIVNTLKEQDV